jgi:hypothetical protein
VRDPFRSIEKSLQHIAAATFDFIFGQATAILAACGKNVNFCLPMLTVQSLGGGRMAQYDNRLTASTKNVSIVVEPSSPSPHIGMVDDSKGMHDWVEGGVTPR